MSHAAFWKAICAEPDDDTPRLVYADWLDEQGDPASVARAEFIRAEIERVGLDVWADPAIELRFRERQLLCEHRDGWLERLPKWVNRTAVRFRHGMPNGFECTASEYVKNAGGLAKHTPLQSMAFGGLDAARTPKMAALPHLARMRALRCTGGSWALWETLLASLHLTGLRSLGLYDPVRGVPVSAILDVLRLPAVRGIQRLELDARPDGELLPALADLPFDDLRHLAVSPEEARPLWLANLLRSPVGEHLEELTFAGLVGRRALPGFVPVPERPRLKALALALVAEPIPELSAALDSPLTQHLEELGLWTCVGSSLRALADSPLARRLRVLRLAQCFAGPDDYRAAFAPGRFPNLVELSVPCVVGQPTLPSLVAAGGLGSLRYLELGGEFGVWDQPDQSLDPLAESTAFPNLRGVVVPSWFKKPLHNAADRAALAAKYADRFAVLVD